MIFIVYGSGRSVGPPSEWSSFVGRGGKVQFFFLAKFTGIGPVIYGTVHVTTVYLNYININPTTEPDDMETILEKLYIYYFTSSDI